jgi:hypothetical protein
MSLDGSKRLDGVWYVMARRDDMENGTQWPEEIGWSMHVMAGRDWMEYGT